MVSAINTQASTQAIREDKQILGHIFSFLSQKELHLASQANKKWKKTAEDVYQLMPHIELRNVQRILKEANYLTEVIAIPVSEARQKFNHYLNLISEKVATQLKALGINAGYQVTNTKPLDSVITRLFAGRNIPCAEKLDVKIGIHFKPETARMRYVYYYNKCLFDMALFTAVQYPKPEDKERDVRHVIQEWLRAKRVDKAMSAYRKERPTSYATLNDFAQLGYADAFCTLFKERQFSINDLLTTLGRFRPHPNTCKILRRLYPLDQSLPAPLQEAWSKRIKTLIFRTPFNLIFTHFEEEASRPGPKDYLEKEIFGSVTLLKKTVKYNDLLKFVKLIKNPILQKDTLRLIEPEDKILLSIHQKAIEEAEKAIRGPVPPPIVMSPQKVEIPSRIECGRILVKDLWDKSWAYRLVSLLTFGVVPFFTFLLGILFPRLIL